MPSSAYVMKGWCIDVTWTPNATLYAPQTFTLRFKAAAGESAWVTQMAQTQMQDMAAVAAPTFGQPYLDPDQSWVVNQSPTWRLYRLEAYPTGPRWRIYRMATGGSSGTPTAWRLYRLSAGASGLANLLPNKLGAYRAGETIAISAVRAGGAPAARTWRIAGTSGVTTTPFAIANVGDVATVRAPISATDCSLTIGYMPAGGPEAFITINVLRAVDWVWWQGKLRPAVWNVVATTGKAVTGIPQAIMAFDGAADRNSYPMHNIGGVTGYSANEGVDHFAQKELAAVYASSDATLSTAYGSTTRHFLGGYRNYGNLPTSFDVNGQPGVTARLLSGPAPRIRVLHTYWVGPDATSVGRSGAATYDAIVAGTYDALMTGFVQSLPIGNARPASAPYWQFRLAMGGELDIATAQAYTAGGGTGSVPNGTKTKARNAVLHMVKVMSAAALAMGATPDEFGVGGLITGFALDQAGYQDYDWWRDIDDATLGITVPAQRNLVVGFADTYFHLINSTTAEDPRTRLRTEKAIFTAAGIKRFIVAETTIATDLRSNRGVPITDAATAAIPQAQWVDWLTEVIDDGTLEWVGYFHDPSGYESGQGKLRGAPLRRLALAAERINLKVLV